MDNLEKLNNDNLNKIWKWFNAVSGEVEISEAQKFFREIIFLKSLSDKINDKNKYYTARLSNAFDSINTVNELKNSSLSSRHIFKSNAFDNLAV